MTSAERRAGGALAAIFALRMLGLFLILPVFAAHAHEYQGGDQLLLVGMALGAYGLTQACLQLAWGAASDHFGRKPVIVAGLVLFAIGSAVAALAGSIEMVIAGRVIQGAGAISAAISALAADLTREQHRTKVMAMIGSSIALVFALSMFAAPLLSGWIGLAGIFWITGALSLLAIVALYTLVPDAPRQPRPPSGRLAQVLRDGTLLRLNLGVFVLHLIQTAMWVLVPAAIIAAGLPLASHWQVYLPAVLVSFAIMVPAVIVAERHGRLRQVFMVAIAALVVVQFGLLAAGASVPALALWLTLFFAAFNVLEATQPSWISRAAPADARGAAMGVYNTLQSLGLFAGGVLGGLVAQNWGAGAVYVMCALLGLLWLALARGMTPPPTRRTLQAAANDA